MKTMFPSTVHVAGLAPPSSTTVMPTLAPLSATICRNAATRALDPSAAAAAVVLGKAPIALSLFDVLVSGARASAISGETDMAAIASVIIAAKRRPMAQTHAASIESGAAGFMPVRVGPAAGRALGDPCEFAELGPYVRVTVMVCEAQALPASHAVIVADPVSTVVLTVMDFEKLPFEAAVVVTCCLVEPPWTTEIVIDWLTPK